MSPSQAETQIETPGPIAYMAQNPVAANILMVLLIVGGLFTLPSIKQEVFPEFQLDIVSISLPYPGASPEEVESGAILAVEEAIQGIDGIEEIQAYALEGSGRVVAELSNDVDPQKVLNDIDSAVGRITSFSKDIEKPVISLASNRREVLSLVVYGELDERALYEISERMRNELLQSPEITYVEVTGIRPFEISIEVSRQKLRRYALTLEEVAQKIRSDSVELPAGGIKTQEGEILVRVDQRKEWGSELSRVVLRKNGEGAELRLGDVAEIKDDFKDVDQRALFNGKPSVIVKVFRVGSQTPITVSNAVKEYIEKRQGLLPQGVKLAVWNDSSENYAGRVDLLVRNAKTGLVLVILILGLFLDFRLSFWITLGIPISFLGALLFLPWFDVSLNMVSLFGFILTLGVVVDDAIVVGESVFQEREAGVPPVRAAIDGTLKVSGPVTFSVLTTIIAFMPLLFVPNVMGKIMRVLPLVVVSILSLSLIESMYILPSHLAHTNLDEPKGLLRFLFRFQKWFARLLDLFIQKIYAPILHFLMKSRYVTLALGLSCIFFTVGLVQGRRVKFIFLPRIDSDVIEASLALPFGSDVSRTEELTHRLQLAAEATLEELGGADKIGRGTLTLIGVQAAGGHATGGSTSSGSHLGQVLVFLVPEDQRDFGARKFARTWRSKLGSLSGYDTLKFKSTNGPSGGADIDIELTHSDRSVLEQAGVELGQMLSKFAGVEDIDDGFALGKRQFGLRLTSEGRAWGLTEAQLGSTLRSSFFGAEAQRLQRGRHEVRTYVRLPEDERSNEMDLNRLTLIGANGGEIPLTSAVQWDQGYAYKEINRLDGRRILNVTAEVDEQIANGNEILSELAKEALPQLLEKYPGLRYRFAGAQESRRESVQAMGQGFLLSLVAMFALMGIAFKSYTQPILILLTVPFGIVGAIWGHMVMGMDLSLMSMFGMVALAGVVVNDSLVLIDAINSRTDEGSTPFEAVNDGAARRFRPILLTSLTTFLGLIPMLLEKSLQARFLIPMAVSLGIGVLFATLITLIIIPAAYLILEDVRFGVWKAISFLMGWDEEE